MAKANWFETAFGAAVDEARSAITDVRSKLIDEAWFGRHPPESKPSDLGWARDDPIGNELRDAFFGEPRPTAPLPEAPVRFYDLPASKDAPPPPEQDHDIDR